MNAHIEQIYIKTSKYQTGIVCPECKAINTVIRHKSLVYCEHCKTIHGIEDIFNDILNSFMHICEDNQITKAKLQKFSNYFFSNYQLQKLFPKSLKQYKKQASVS